MGDPVAQGVVDRVLQGPAARDHLNHLGAQKLHPEHVEGLPFDVPAPHVDAALHVEFGADRGHRHPVLARARFGDDPLFAHPPGQKDLAERIIDLV